MLASGTHCFCSLWVFTGTFLYYCWGFSRTCCHGVVWCWRNVCRIIEKFGRDKISALHISRYVSCYDYSPAYWDSLSNHLRDVPWENTLNLVFQLLLLVLLLSASVVSGFKLELMYISLTVGVRWNLIHLHAFQLLMLLPWFIEINFLFVSTE